MAMSIKTFGQMSYISGYHAREDQMVFIGWIGEDSMLVDLPGFLYRFEAAEPDPDRLRAESLALSRMEAFLIGTDPHVLAIKFGHGDGALDELEGTKVGIWSQENTDFLRNLFINKDARDHAIEAHLQSTRH